MEDKAIVEEEKKDVQNAALLLGTSVGVGVAGTIVADGVKSLDLDLVSTTTETGIPTGHGNMFENCIVREHPGAVKVNNPGSSTNKLLREKNGVDIRFPDGTNVQCKCCATPEGAVNSMMKGGKFRYEGQTIAVPRGQGEQVKELLKERGVNTLVIESKYTYEQVRELSVPGRKSASFVATDYKIMGGSAILAAVVGGTFYLYEYINHPNKPWWKRILNAAGIAVGTFGIAEVSALAIAYARYKRIS